jgi:hypothetical protein
MILNILLSSLSPPPSTSTVDSVATTLQNLDLINRTNIYSSSIDSNHIATLNANNNIDKFEIVNHMKNAKKLESQCENSTQYDSNVCDFLKLNIESLIFTYFIYALLQKYTPTSITNPTGGDGDGDGDQNTVNVDDVINKVNSISFDPEPLQASGTFTTDASTETETELKEIKSAILKNSKMLESMKTKVDNGESRLRKIWWENLFMMIGVILYLVGVIIFLALPETIITKNAKAKMVLILSTVIILSVIIIKILYLLNIKRLVRSGI